MGRRRTVHRDLPPHLYLRKGGYYYRHPNGQEERVAKEGDKAIALIKWAQYEGEKLAPNAVTFGAVAEQFRINYIPKRAAKTQKDYNRQLDNLVVVFGNSALDSIRPVDVTGYRDKRSAKTQANREMAVLSMLWNWARENGYTDGANPVTGIKRNKEHGRGVYMTDEVFDAIHSHGDQSVKDAMNIGSATGMDCNVILKAKRTAIKDDVLTLQRTKTSVPVRYRLKDARGRLNWLGKVIKEMLNRKRSATGQNLIQDDDGQSVPYDTFADRFDRARTAAGYKPGEYQFRDIRPKVATDQDDVQRAKGLLGHKHVSTTERHYIRRGKLVDPAK